MAMKIVKDQYIYHVNDSAPNESKQSSATSNGKTGCRASPRRSPSTSSALDSTARHLGSMRISSKSSGSICSSGAACKSLSKTSLPLFCHKEATSNVHLARQFAHSLAQRIER